jgi:hypothetical protein
MKTNLVKSNKKKNSDERKVIFEEVPETGELEIQTSATENIPAKKVRFPEDVAERYKLPPEEFVEVQDAIEAYQAEDREILIYANSIESKIGYDSLIRVLGNYFGKQMAYFRSVEGGSLSLEAALACVYKNNFDEAQATNLINEMVSIPTDTIGFSDLLAVHRNSPAMAENLWEAIKREAQREFESGHRAANAFEPADYMKDAWNRAGYLGLRESFCAEWQPKGGIELSMIDTIAQAFLQLQFWTKESVLRSQTKPREEDHEVEIIKKLYNERNKHRRKDELWDIPLVSQQSAVEHAAQMADRWQRMYFRAIKNLRDWRRLTPQVTINNPSQVNIANDGGQQVNVASNEK